MTLRSTLRWLTAKRHPNPVPDGTFRLLLLTDYPWPTYIGGREWCDSKPQPCQYPGCDRCCACRHTEARP